MSDILYMWLWGNKAPCMARVPELKLDCAQTQRIRIMIARWPVSRQTSTMGETKRNITRKTFVILR